MYFSKITFSPTHLTEMVRHFRRGLFHEHQMIWDLFAKDEQAKRDFLYCRQEADGGERFPFYYLLSRREPASDRPEFIIQTRPYSPQLKQGDDLQFSLRANATKMVKTTSSSKHYKRRSLIEAHVDKYKREFPDAKDRPSKAYIHHEAGEEWLIRQGRKAGFQVNRLFVENHQFHRMKKTKKPHAKPQCFTSIDFTGQIQVTQPELFLKACFYATNEQTNQLIAGFGRSKAFGCGLMLIRRI